MLINSVSTQTSLFNDSHLKLNNLAMNIKDVIWTLNKQINQLNEEIGKIENSKFNTLKATPQTKQTILNGIELIKSKIFKSSEKFKKSIQLQTEVKYYSNRLSKKLRKEETIFQPTTK